jgi:hypothetical protein
VPPAEARALVNGYLDSPGYREANREMRAGVFGTRDGSGFP